jgi:hypothetical protein
MLFWPYINAVILKVVLTMVYRLTPGSYVIAFFPHTDNPTQPGDKNHPCLVLDPADFGLGENVAVLLPSTREQGDPENYINVRSHVHGLHLPRDPRKGPFVNIHRPVALPLEGEGRGAFFTNLETIARMDEGFYQSIRAQVLASHVPVDTAPLSFKFEGLRRRPMPDLSGRPEPGSYVLCRFPFSDAPWEPGGKLRPALVMGYDKEYGLQPPVAILAYSTSGERGVVSGDRHRSFLEVREYVSDLDIPDNHGPYVDVLNVRALPITRDFFPKGMHKIGELAQDGFDIVKALANTYNVIPDASAVDFYNAGKAAIPGLVHWGDAAREIETQFLKAEKALRPDDNGFINLYNMKPDDPA